MALADRLGLFLLYIYWIFIHNYEYFYSGISAQGLGQSKTQKYDFKKIQTAANAYLIGRGVF